MHSSTVRKGQNRNRSIEQYLAPVHNKHLQFGDSQDPSHTPIDEETKDQSATNASKKQFLYSNPNVQIGLGKYGPVNLIIHEGQLFALKIIPKTSIDKPKRIEHVKNEKKLLIALRKDSESREPLDFIVELHETFIDHDNINFVFEYLPG